MTALDTIFALSSGRPPAAVSIIRVSGPRAHEAGERIAGALPKSRAASVRELRHPRSGELLDRALVLKFVGPASSTGEDIVEFQCHGGRAVVDSVLAALGCLDDMREALPGEFTRRAFDNGRIDLTEAEGLADLIEAETEVQRKAALTLAEGRLSKQIEVWRERLLGLSARVEQAIDYDEDDGGADSGLLSDCSEFAAELHDWLHRPRIEALKDGIQVVVAGPPNSGKSSLLNAIVGSERAIVTEIPGTTRDHIEVPLAVSGLPILLIDTAGLRKTKDVVEAIGVARASALMSSADVLLWLGEPAAAPSHPWVIRIHAQSDRPERQRVPSESLAVSSTTGQGLAELLERIAATARTLLPGDGAIALNRRQAVLVEEAAGALGELRNSELVILAENLRRSRSAFDRLTGRAGVEDMLDELFGRFCLGK